jgi:chromosome partitioning protein
MKLFAVMSHKGGVGKTTSAVYLAEELAAKGYRTLLVDADRQQGAGLLLEIGAPSGDVQPTRIPGLSYMGSAKLTEQEIATRAAAAAGQFDIGVVDTPSLDDSLAQAWLQQAHATLMIMQVEPLTVKTFPSALATLESVRRLNPKIEIVGLLPTMFDPTLETHRTCLTELLTRKPEAVFTPVVPSDPGLMHRAAGQGAPEISPAARQSYQVAADRIIRVLNPTRSGTGAPAAQASASPWETQTAPASTAFPAQAPAAWPAAPAQAVSAAAPQGYDAGAGYGAPASPFAAPAPPAAAAGGHPGWGAPQQAPPPPQPAWGAAPQHAPPGGHPAPHAYASQPAFGGGAYGAPGPYGMGQSATSDEQAPDWWQGSQGHDSVMGRAREGSSGRGMDPTAGRRSREGSGRPAWAPFALGFAAACILLLLAWVGGVFRKMPLQSPKPGVTPAHAAPSGQKKAMKTDRALVGETVVAEKE